MFDFDGTLIDTSPGIIRSAKEAGREMGLTLPSDEAFRAFIGPPLIDSFMTVYGLNEDDAARASDIYRRIYDDTGAINEAELYPGMMALLKDMREAGIKTAIASMKRQPLLDEMTDFYGLRPLFDSVKGAPPPPGRGNKPEIIRSLLQELGTIPEETVMVGDSFYDGDAAEETGTRLAGVLWGFGFEKPEDVLKYPDSIAVYTMDDLRRVMLG